MSTQKVDDGLSLPGGANPSKRIISKLFWGAVLVLGLVLAALYTPLLQKSNLVNALEPQPATYAAPANAPVRAVDQTLLVIQTALAALYEQVAPSVVNIQVTMGGVRNGLPEPGQPEGAPQQGQGSGFIYDNNGRIVTNNHVVEGADQITVVFNDGRWAKAEVVAADPQADLAVLKVTPPKNMQWQPLPLAEPDGLRVGYTVIAIGNPFGLAGTMTTGIVSALGRGMPIGGLGESRYTLPDVIQTDTAINPGNSGGPLLNLAGEVVGINFAIESPARVNSGVGFAIPASIVRRVVPALIANGKFTYAYLGLSGRAIDATLAAALELPTDQLGVYVAEVVPGGPAAKAGIRAAQPGGGDAPGAPRCGAFVRPGRQLSLLPQLPRIQPGLRQPAFRPQLSVGDAPLLAAAARRPAQSFPAATGWRRRRSRRRGRRGRRRRGGGGSRRGRRRGGR